MNMKTEYIHAKNLKNVLTLQDLLTWLEDHKHMYKGREDDVILYVSDNFDVEDVVKSIDHGVHCVNGKLLSVYFNFS